MALVNDLIIGALETSLHRPQFAYLAPTYVQAKRIAWDYIKDYGGPLQPKGHKPNESELRIEIISSSGTPARIFLAGADNPDSLRGIYLDGAVVDESPLISPTVTKEILLPALLDRKGWMVHAGTPKGKNHFHKTYTHAKENPNEWFSMLMPASMSGIFKPEELADLKAQMDPDEYEQEMECSFSATSKGQILFKDIMAARAENRIGPHLKPLPLRYSVVIASFDIGFSDTATCWLWQITPQGFRLIGYISHVGLEAQDWIDILIGLPLPPSVVYLPHDAKAKTFATKHSPQEQFIRCDKFRVHMVPRTSVLDRVNAARTVMPYCEFCEGEPGIQQGLECLQEWAYSWNDDLGTYSQTPLHNWASHGGDGFSYGAQMLAYHVEEARKNQAKMKQRQSPLLRPANHQFHLEQLFEAHNTPRRTDGF